MAVARAPVPQTDALPNHWHFFGLRESPYFQTTLGDAPARYPLSLFVGREAEVEQLLAGIGGSSSSRQAVGGAPGVGKTTLAKQVKATAAERGYWATTELIPFHTGDTVEWLVGRILDGIYEALLTARPATAEHPAMQRAQQHVRAFRDGPRVIRELLDIALQGGARGVVLHLDNLENLAERDLARAADMLRSLRDPVLLQDGLHVILVGTADAIGSTITTHTQLRSVFSLHALGPLPVADVQALLAARYSHIALREGEPVSPPVTQSTVAKVYSLFRGDLRGLLKALEEGVSLLVGVVGKHPGAPIPLSSLRRALQTRYADILVQVLSRPRQRQLQQWAESLGAIATPTQDQLKSLWRLSQPAVSQALADLGRAGYVLPLPRKGALPGTYALTGASRLIFD